MNKQKLLIVDDSPEIHDLVQVWLVGEPLEFFSCYDGEKTLSTVRDIKPDLILLDVDLPGEDGFSICRRLKSEPSLADIPVVFLTGASSTEEKLRGLELGAADYVFKPFDPAELRARVRCSLHNKQLMDLLAEKANVLAESEARFRLLAENSSDVILRHSADGVCLYASPAASSVLGYQPGDLHGKVFAEFVHPDDRPLVERSFTRPTASAIETVEFRFLRRDGQYVWLEAACHQCDEDGRGGSHEVHASARDISGRKQLEFREQIRADVLGKIAQGCALNEILGHLVAAIEQQESTAAAAGVLLAGETVHCCAPHLPASLVQSIEWQLYSLVEHFSALASNGNSRAIFCDLRTDPAWEPLRPLLVAHRLESCWAVLIRASSREACGAFTIYRRDRLRPNPSSVELMKLASDLTGIAIEHRQLTDRLVFQAHHDALTQLPNRVLFTDRLRQVLPLSDRSNQSAGVLLIDVDHFKHVNDTYGHQAGDEMLCQVADRFRRALRTSDTLARMGGDEFAVILNNLNDPSDARAVADTLLRTLKEPLTVSGQPLFATVSIGSAVYPRDARDAETLFKHADLALYRAKDGGRNTCCAFAPEMGDASSARLELESSLRQAIARDELRLYYQPQVDLDGHVRMVEALVRWQHPRLGLVPPAKFIPIAESTGLIVPLGAWVFHEAGLQAKRWYQNGLGVVPIAVNVSTLQFAQSSFIRTVSAALQTAGLAEPWLQIELTESLLMKNMRDAVEKLAQLKQLDVSVAVDDFGTGYSSLAYLQRLRLDVLKIDHSFTADLEIGGNASGRAIVQAILSLAQSLQLQVVAEGVETPGQRDILALSGCERFQGYLFSAPKSATDIEPFLRRQFLAAPKTLARTA